MRPNITETNIVELLLDGQITMSKAQFLVNKILTGELGKDAPKEQILEELSVV